MIKTKLGLGGAIFPVWSQQSAGGRPFFCYHEAYPEEARLAIPYLNFYRLITRSTWMRIQVHALASLLRASFGRMRWSVLEKTRSLKMAPCLVWLGLNHISNTSRPSPAREEGALYGPGTATAVAIFSCDLLWGQHHGRFPCRNGRLYPMRNPYTAPPLRIGARTTYPRHQDFCTPPH